MSAKHKRPFYVFAAVAAVCCMVLVTGIRGSKADDGGGPVVGGSLLTESGALIERSPGAGDLPSPDVDPGTTGSAGTRLDGDLNATIPGLEGSLPDGGNAEVGPSSGVSLLPPYGLPLQPEDVDPGDVTVPPVSDDTSDDNRPGERDGKRGKDKDKDDESEDETEADAESEDEVEVDPDVYGLPEDEGEEGDELEGDQSEEPVDPEATP